MNCKSVQIHLSAYLDRELSGAEMLVIRAHLVECRICREEEESLRALKRLLAATVVPDPSPDLADRLCASVLSHHRPKRTSGGFVAPFRSAAITFVAVAVCTMAVTYTVLSRAQSAADPVSADVAAGNSSQDLAFDVQRDQVYATGLDATSGVPVLSAPQDARR